MTQSGEWWLPGLDRSSRSGAVMAEMICLQQGKRCRFKDIAAGAEGSARPVVSAALSVPRCQCRVVRGATGYRLLPAPVVSGNHQ